MKTNRSLDKLFGLLLSVLGILGGMSGIRAQSVNGTQQLPNRGFEEYDNLGDKSVEPVGWNSFMTANTTGSTALGQACRLERVEQIRPGSSGKYSMRVFSTSIIGVIANGNVTTGRINMGSTTPSSPSNYNFTDRASDGFNVPFTAVPDSMVFWVRYNPNSASDQGQIKALIHNDNNTIDPGAEMSQVVAVALMQPEKGNGDWIRYSAPFDRTGCGSRDARYILVSITTNKINGGGAAEIWVDDLLFVYNPTIRIGALPVTYFNMRDGAATLDIPFTVTGTLPLNANSEQKSRVVAELSDAEGSFAHPVIIGSAETEQSGVLTAAIPATMPLGEHYKVRLRGVDRDVLSEPCAEDIVLMRGYTVEVESDNLIQGAVSGGRVYQQGATATVVATPFTGYHFDHWEENGKTVADAGASYSFTVNGDRKLVAFFAINTYRLEVESEGNGSVRTVSGKDVFEHNERVRLEASPDEGYEFGGYYSDGVLLSQSEVYQFNILRDMRITARFVRGKINISATAAQPDLGSVSGSGLYEAGSTVKVTATPLPYCHFVAWLEGRDTVSKEAVYTFTAEKNRILSAVFEQEYHTVSVTPNIVGAGVLTGAGRYSAASSSTTIVLKAEPNLGYEFLYWKSLKDGTEYEDNPFVVLEDGRLTEDLEYEACFSIEHYQIALEAIPEGAGSVQGAGVYEFRTRVTLRATPLEHYRFVAWVRTDHGLSDTVYTNPFVFPIEEGRDRYYQALFTLKQHTVSLSAEPASYGNVSGSGLYVHFDTAVLQAQAEPGYEFLYWGTRRGLNIDKVSEENPCKIAVVQDVEWVAVFSQQRKEVQAVCLPPEAGTVSGTGLYAAGTYAALAAEPVSGYRFVQWEDAHESPGLKDNLLHFIVRNDTTLYARFSPLRYTFTLMTEGASSLGQVRINDGSYASRHIREVYYGDTLHLSALAVAPDYSFTQWRMVYTQDGVLKDSLYSRKSEEIYVVSGESRIVAYFVANAHHITAAVMPRDVCGEVLNQGNYRHELWMELVAAPAKGYTFSYWADRSGKVLDNTSARLQIQSMKDSMVQAVFEPEQLPVEVEIRGGKTHGTVEGEGLYVYGTQARLKAEPAYGYAFAGWYAADDTLQNRCLSNEKTFLLEVRERARLAAVFAPGKFTLRAEITPAEAGQVKGTGSYDYMSEAILQAVPAGGYAVKYMLLEREPGTFDTLRENFAGCLMDKDRYVQVVFENTPYSLQVFSSNTAQGSVRSDQTASHVGYGSRVLLQAMPFENYVFSQWRDARGNRLSREAGFSIEIHRDTVVYADFTPATKSFRAESDNLLQGYVKPYGNRPTYGSIVTVEAEPNAGYEFDRWVLAKDLNTAVSHSSVLTVAVTQDTSFVACFRPVFRDIRLTANIREAGSLDMQVSGKDMDGWQERYARVRQGTKVMLYAYPFADYDFSAWVWRGADGQGLTLGETSGLEIEITDDMELEAVFEPKLHQASVQAVPAEFGSVQGSGIYAYGNEITVKAEPVGNYAFKGWKSADGWLSYQAEYRFTIDKDTSITAYFTHDSVRVDAYAGIGGVVAGSGLYAKGEEVTLQAEASGRYTFEAWCDPEGNRISTRNPYTMVPEHSLSLQAVFVPEMLRVEVEAEEGGMVLGGGGIVYGAPVLLEAVPDEGYRFVRWESADIALDSLKAVLPVLGWQVFESGRLKAVFEPLMYLVETKVSPLAAGTVSSGGEFSYGSVMNFEARPDAHHTFKAWMRNGKEVSTESVLSVEVKQDETYVALFAPKRYNVVTEVYPERGGLSYGGGSYYWGDTAQVGIYLYDSVIFKSWMDAEANTVSVAPEFSKEITQIEIFTATVDAPPEKPIGDTIQVGPSGKLIVYPNPLPGNAELHIKAGAKKLMSLRIFTVSGKYLLYRKFSEQGEQEVSLRLPNLVAGCYFYEIKLEDGSAVKGKLMKL